VTAKLALAAMPSFRGVRIGSTRRSSAAAARIRSQVPSFEQSSLSTEQQAESDRMEEEARQRQQRDSPRREHTLQVFAETLAVEQVLEHA
jgi:hypothetical protein